jgi:hypothetical protein
LAAVVLVLKVVLAAAMLNTAGALAVQVLLMLQDTKAALPFLEVLAAVAVVA